MTPPSLTPPVKPKPAKPASPASAQTGAAASPSVAPPAPHDGGTYGGDHKPGHAVPASVLDSNGAFTFLHTIDPQETKRLLTRTGRGTREEMERELPRYVERIVKRAIESEIY